MAMETRDCCSFWDQIGNFSVQLKRIETGWPKNIHRATLMLNISQSQRVIYIEGAFPILSVLHLHIENIKKN